MARRKVVPVDDSGAEVPAKRTGKHRKSKLSLAIAGRGAEKRPAAEPDDGAVDQALVESTVQEVRKRYEATAETMFEKGNQGMVEIGRYLLLTFFDDDPVKASARGRKPASLRALAEHPQMPIGKTQLNVAIRAASLQKELEDGGVKHVKALSASHLVELLKAPAQQREKLVGTIVEEKLSVRQLQDRLALKALPAAGRTDDGERTKIPRPLLTFLKLDAERLGNPERLAKLPKRQLAKYRKTLEDAAERIRLLLKAVSVALG